MTEKTFTLPDRIEAVQALRFFGAMCITVYHFSGLTGACPFDFSHAVYLFYIISGFMVMYSTADPAKKKHFLTRRLIRTLPLYWGLTLASFAAGLAVPAVIGYRPTLEHLVKSLLFIPFARVTAKAGVAIRPIVGLGHTLQMEMLFYVLFLIALRISHKYRGVIAAGLAAAIAVAGQIWRPRGPVLHFYSANPYVWASFIVGLALYGVFALLQKKRLPLKNGLPPALAAVAVAVALTVPALCRGASPWYSIALFAAALTAGLTWSACGLPTPKPLVTLGNISFSYYLLHYYTVTLSARYLGIDSFRLRDWLLALAVSAVTWGISWVSWYLIEKQLAAWLQKKLIIKSNEGDKPTDAAV